MLRDAFFIFYFKIFRCFGTFCVHPNAQDELTYDRLFLAEYM